MAMIKIVPVEKTSDPRFFAFHIISQEKPFAVTFVTIMLHAGVKGYY
jgi:hypothetical protein